MHFDSFGATLVLNDAIRFSIMFWSIVWALSVFPTHFEINGKPTLLRSGSFPWYRLPQSQWEDRLKKFKAVGYNMLEIYVSWQFIEPQPTQFNTKPLQLFLEMVQRHQMLVYIRPGPYVCNEENSGGFPEWIIANSTKIIRPDEYDGKYALRTNDKDFLFIVRRYFKAINQVISQFVPSTVILYQIENEYNYYEDAVFLEQYAWLDGGRERPLNTTLDTLSYLTALKEMVLEDIDISITTCPSNYELKGMGGITGVLPLPNFYHSFQDIEKEAVVLKTRQRSMSNVQMYPTGISETFRSPTMMARSIMAGMDLVNNFNAMGMYTHGHHNSAVFRVPGVTNPGDILSALHHFIRLHYEDIMNGFLTVPLSLFPSVVDYNGVISPSGQFRQKYHVFRRLNAFYDSFEHLLAPVDTPSIYDKWCTTQTQTVYALENGIKVVGIVNTGKPMVLPPHSITLYNRSIPLHTPMLVPNQPLETIQLPDKSVNGNNEMDYMFHLVYDMPIGPYTMSYTTAQVLLVRDNTLILYNTLGSMIEYQFDTVEVVQIQKQPQIRYYGDVTIFIISEALASRTHYLDGWYFGIDAVYDKTISMFSNQEVMSYKGSLFQAYKTKQLGDWSFYTFPTRQEQPVSIQTVNTHAATFDQTTSHTGSIEQMNVGDHIVYTTTFSGRQCHLQVESASDFVTVIVNGHIVKTLAPLGTRIDNQSWNGHYRFTIPKRLLKMENTLSLRTSVWGRGNFMFPQGYLGRFPIANQLWPTGLTIRAPIAGFEHKKGLFNATINREPVSFDIQHDLNWHQNGTTHLPIHVGNGQLLGISFTLPFKQGYSLKLHGKGILADIVQNSTVVGRYISDDSVMASGNYYSVDRQAWTYLNVSHTPMHGGPTMIQLDGRTPNAILYSIEYSIATEMMAPNGQQYPQWQNEFQIN